MPTSTMKGVKGLHGYGTFAEVEAKYAPQTFAEVEALMVGKTFAQAEAIMAAVLRYATMKGKR